MYAYKLLDGVLFGLGRGDITGQINKTRKR